MTKNFFARIIVVFICDIRYIEAAVSLRGSGDAATNFADIVSAVLEKSREFDIASSKADEHIDALKKYRNVAKLQGQGEYTKFYTILKQQDTVAKGSLHRLRGCFPTCFSKRNFGDYVFTSPSITSEIDRCVVGLKKQLRNENAQTRIRLALDFIVQAGIVANLRLKSHKLYMRVAQDKALDKEETKKHANVAVNTYDMSTRGAYMLLEELGEVIPEIRGPLYGFVRKLEDSWERSSVLKNAAEWQNKDLRADEQRSSGKMAKGTTMGTFRSTPHAWGMQS